MHQTPDQVARLAEQRDNLLRAADRVIAAGHLDPATDGDVEYVQGQAHSALADAVTAIRANAAPEQPAKPDYWTALAADLHQAADRLATLAGTTPLPSRVDLSILGSATSLDTERMVPLVNALAEAFGTTAGPDEETPGTHGAQIQIGAVHVHPYTCVPKVSELDRLRAEVAALRAQQAGGAL